MLNILLLLIPYLVTISCILLNKEKRKRLINVTNNYYTDLYFIPNTKYCVVGFTDSVVNHSCFYFRIGCKFGIAIFNKQKLISVTFKTEKNRKTVLGSDESGTSDTRNSESIHKYCRVNMCLRRICCSHRITSPARKD